MLILKVVHFSTRSCEAKTDSKQGSCGPKLKHHQADGGAARRGWLHLRQGGMVSFACEHSEEQGGDHYPWWQSNQHITGEEVETREA